MTEVTNLVEDIVSDEYEEGEILDDDILYENVSSLEEFSDPEDKKTGNKGLKVDVKKLKNRRKKEHKCKEDSVCRKERSGKHCYARIRKRKSSLDSKLKNSSAKGVSLDFDKKQRPASARQISPTRGSAKRDSFSRETAKGKGKLDDRGRYPPYYFQHDNRDRANPPRRNTSDRRPARTRRFSADDRRENDRKRKSRSPSPRPNAKHLHETNRVVAKTSLLDRLVGSGSITQKSSVSCESDDGSTKIEHLMDTDPQVSDSSILPKQDETEGTKILKPIDITEETTSGSRSSGNTNVCNAAIEKKDDPAYQIHNLCPEDIPVPPTPKATSPVPEPPKEEIDELHLRLVALKTAIMKKQNDFKRKKRLAASKKSFKPGNDSFMEFALMGIGEDECESIPTPPPPGTDSWPPSTIRDLDDPRWSDEDMVIDQESNYGDTIIEANIPASEPNAQNYVKHSVSVSSPSSQDKLPCCKGNPIPVVSPHRPAKEIEERRPALSSSTSVIVPVREIRTPVVKKETPKYLKEINSNFKPGMKRRKYHPRRTRHRRNSLRQRTPAVRRGDRSLRYKEPMGKKSKVFEGDDDEEALRQLALMSVKPKSTITGGMLSTIGKNLDPLHIETDPVELQNKSECPAKTPSPAEAWEDIDEDILRAQLLSSLTRNIPEPPSQPELPSVPVKRVVIERKMPLRKDVLIKRLNKENLYTKRNVIMHHNNAKPSKRNPKKYINPNVKASLTPPLNPPVVEKFIINVSESETSEDEQKAIRGKIVSDFESAVCRKFDIESSIDKLLEEARKETELIQKATPYYPMYDVGPEALPEIKEEAASTYDGTELQLKLEPPSPVEQSLESPSEVPDVSPLPEDNYSQPVGTSHLPAWQQEEFERQKRIMAQKESVIAAAQAKIRAKNLLASVTACEELARKNSSSKPCSSGKSNPPSDDIEKSKTDGVIHSDDADLTTADPPHITEETSDGCDSKAVDLSSVNSGSNVFEPKGENVVISENERCIKSEVWSCMEVMMTRICADLDAESSGSTWTSNTAGTAPDTAGIAPDTAGMAPDTAGTEPNTAGTAPDTAGTAPDSSKSVAVPSSGTGSVAETPSTCTSNPILSSESSKLRTAETSLTKVAPSRISKDGKLLVSRPADTKTSGTVVSSTQGPSPQQLKKILQIRMAEYRNAIGDSSKSTSRAVASPAKLVVPQVSPARGTVNPAVQKNIQLPILTNAKQLMSSQPNGVAHSAVNKPLFAVKDSSYALKGLNEMTELVAGLENGMSEYKNLRKEFIARRKQLMLIQQKVSKKRQQLLEMKDTIENKKRLLQSTISMDTSSLSPLPDTRDQPKQSSRASELLALKFKEVCLKAQFAMMGLETASRPQAAVKMRPVEDLNPSPRKKMKIRARQPIVKAPLKPVLPPNIPKSSQSESTDPGTSHKLVVSVRDKDKMDPLIPLCPYDIKGVCKDEECQYQHLKN